MQETIMPSKAGSARLARLAMRAKRAFGGKKGIILFFAVVFLSGCAALNSNTNAVNQENLNIAENANSADATSLKSNVNSVTNNKTMPIVKIKTSKGDITFELFTDDAPKTVANFITLAKRGYYDGVIFHRVISGFMIQGGDPTGTGSGNPGYKFADELDSKTPSYQRGYMRGVLAMANSGPNTNGSQFFIMHQDYPLPHAYTIFGRVTSGIEIVDAIAQVKTDSADRPLEKVLMEKVEVIE